MGSRSAADQLILEYASENDLVVFTHDLDFGALLAHRKTSKPSVIQIRCQDVLPDAIGEIIIRAILATQQHLEAGALVTVEMAKNRVRILPFA